MKKSLKMAIASSDGKVINQHFGKARRFIIIEPVEAPGFIEENALAYARYRLKES